MSEDWRAIDPEEDQRVVPTPDGLSADFYQRVARGELCFQRCGSCGKHRHPPRYLCPTCGSGNFRWAPSAGTGRLFSWTVTHRPIDPAWAKISLPYATVVVAMEEGVRVVGALKDASPRELRLELPMRALIERKSEEFGFIWFRPER